MKVLSANELIEKIGLSRTTIWRMERQGNFPKRIHLSPRRVGWILEEVEEWIETRSRI